MEGSPQDRIDEDEGASSSEGFDACISTNQKFIEVLVRTLGVPASDVHDVLQDANLYLVKNQGNYRPGTNFRAWAAQVVRYRCLIYFRARKRRPMINLSEQALDLIAGEVIEQFDESEVQLRRLQHCLAKLSVEQRDLLAATYSSELSLKDYAAKTHKSHTAVRKTISRVRQMLKSCIENIPDS